VETPKNTIGISGGECNDVFGFTTVEDGRAPRQWHAGVGVAMPAAIASYAMPPRLGAVAKGSAPMTFVDFRGIGDCLWLDVKPTSER